MKAERRIVVLVAGGLLAASATVAAEAPHRYQATITITQPAAFAELALPVQAYGHSQQPGLADLRLLDAKGQRVPFALLLPRPDPMQAQERQVRVAMYRGPRLAAGLPPSIDVVVQQQRVEVRQRAGLPTTAAAGDAGWLFDTGARKAGEAAPQSLLLHWPVGAIFDASYSLDTSPDLRQWQRGGRGQVMSLSAAQGVLSQPLVVLAPNSDRFVRLMWADPARAPKLESADAVFSQEVAGARDLPTRLSLVASPEPATEEPATTPARKPRGDPTTPGGQSLHYDLGGVLDLRSVLLELPSGSSVVPVRVQQRNTTRQPWTDLTQGVFYRSDEDGQVQRSPALGVQTQARYLRVLTDARVGLPDPARIAASASVYLARLVFAAQAPAPYQLLVGSADASAGPLPMATLLPKLGEELPQMGRAELGAFSERPEAAKAAQTAALWAAWRPRLLWAVLLLGVAGLAAMVWRLARGQTKPSSASAK